MREKNKVSLEEAIEMINEEIKPKEGAYFGEYWTYAPEGTAEIETDKYYVKATIGECHFWSIMDGGVNWSKNITVNYYDKSTRLVNSEILFGIKTEDKETSRKDIRSLWGYDKVKIISLKDDVLTLRWAGKKVQEDTPTYRMNLKTGEYKKIR